MKIHKIKYTYVLQFLESTDSELSKSYTDYKIKPIPDRLGLKYSIVYILKKIGHIGESP